MITLWNKNQERDFFNRSLEIAKPEQIFYQTTDQRYYAYWPKGYKDQKTTLQSRNALIGSFTEKWNADLLRDLADKIGGYPVQGVVCQKIGLTRQSVADIAICKTKNVVQQPENIIMILETKMSIVWNWELILKSDEEFNLKCIGDYKTHTGVPSFLRSDTMLKAIGKGLNIRISDFSAANIPIIVIGNTPINQSYQKKVDMLKLNGIIQGFWSVNPNPLDNNGDNLKRTPHYGFYRFDSYEELERNALDLLKEERVFFSSMQTKKRLGKIIEIANKKDSYEEKAQKFLDLLKEKNN